MAASSAQPPSAPSLADLPLQHDLAAAWPLYSPSAALSCKRGSGELQSRILDNVGAENNNCGFEAAPPRDPPPPRHLSFFLPAAVSHHHHNNPDDYSHKKNEDLFVHSTGASGALAVDGGGKSQPQREKDDEEDRGRRDGIIPEVVVCLRENKMKAESDLELLHSSRGTPIPTRRKKGTASPSSPAASPPLPLSTLGSKSAHHHLNIRGSTHINIRGSNSNMTTLDGSSDMKRKQYEQFMAMAQVMKGDSFDTMEEISPPTSPRFLTVSTGSGLMGLKSQQHRYHTHISNSKNLIEGSGALVAGLCSAAAKTNARPPLPSSPTAASAAAGSSKSSARFQSFLLLAFITLFIAGTILLTVSYSTSPHLFSFSRGPSRSTAGRVTNPEDLDNTWLAERGRRGRGGKTFEVDPFIERQPIRSRHLQPSEDEDDPNAPIDDSYKNKDYTFLLHNALPRVAQNGTVIMVIANSGYLEFLLNWKSYVDSHNITNYVIIPSDVQMAQQLSYLGVDWAYDPEIGMDALSQSVSYTMDKGSRDWANWNKVVHKKSHYFKKIVEMGYSVMVSDIDMVWLKNPFIAMGDADVDIFFTNDGSAPNKDMSICGGLFYGKNREKSLAFINHVINCEVTQKKKEQLCMNTWLGAVSGKTDAINISASEKPNFKVMGVDDFPSGAYFFGNKWAKTEFPYVVHNNWIVGKANKLKRFKAFGYWRVDDSSLRNLMINFRFDDHRGKPGRGREGEIADELMVYHTEMRKKFGRFDDRIWLLEKPPVPRMKAADAKPAPKKATVATTLTSAKAPVRTVAKKTNAAPAKVGPPRKVTPTRETVRNSKYKYIDGNRNPHYSSGR